MSEAKLQQRLEQLRQLRAATPDDSVLFLLRKSVRDRGNLIVAEAAKAGAELRLSALVPDLLAALDRLYEDPVKADPKCWGKTAIVKALAQISKFGVDHRPSPFARREYPVWLLL